MFRAFLGCAQSYFIRGMTADTFCQGMFVLRALYFGTAAAKANYALQIKTLVLAARLKLGPVPVIFGECGIPMDIK